MISFLNLIRWKNLAILGITQGLVRFFLVKQPFNDIWSFLLLVFSTLLIAAAGYIVNDYFDIKIDLINKPDEVYIGRTIKRRYAAILHQALSFMGILLGWLVNWKIFVINLISVILLWFYASTFKRMPLIGNVVVAFLTALSIFEISFLVSRNAKLVFVYAVFAFFMTIVREIVKDIEDTEGDRKHAAHTLPVMFGLRLSKNVIYLFFGFLVLSVVLFLYLIKNPHLNVAFSVLLVFSVYLIYKIIKADRKAQFSEISRLCKYLMILGVGSMIFI